MDARIVMFNGDKYVRSGKSRYYFKYTTKNEERKNAKQLHRAVWEYYNGEIPKGCQIHHIDGNVDNNDISNLECLTAKEHLSLHAEKNKGNPEYLEAQKASIKLANIASKEWHKSEEGREWHRKHVKESIGKTNENRHKKTCLICGTVYMALPWQKFCSLKCQQRDHLNKVRKFIPYERPCDICGKIYLAKNSNSKFCCAKCKAKNQRQKNK